MFCGGGRRRGRIILFAYVTHSSCDTGRISGRGDTEQPITNSEKEPQACTGTRANGASLVVQWPRTSDFYLTNSNGSCSTSISFHTGVL